MIGCFKLKIPPFEKKVYGSHITTAAVDTANNSTRNNHNHVLPLLWTILHWYHAHLMAYATTVILSILAEILQWDGLMGCPSRRDVETPLKERRPEGPSHWSFFRNPKGYNCHPKYPPPKFITTFSFDEQFNFARSSDSSTPKKINTYVYIYL